MPSRASPSVGHSENLPDDSTYLRALALELQMKERKKALSEAHKRVRASIEGSGVNLEDLDTLYKLRDKTPEDIEQWFRRKFAALGSYFRRLPEQFDLFRERPEAVDGRRDAYRHKGRIAGIEGKEARPPAGVTSDESNAWMDGFHEGAAARKESEPILANILADALKIADEGGVVDGTRLTDGGTVGSVTETTPAQSEAEAAEAAGRLAAAGLDD